MSPIVVLVNAHARLSDAWALSAGQTHDAAARVADAFTAAGCEASVRLVHGAQIGMECRKALADGSGLIVAGGGDGTVSSVASALVGTGATLGVLPLGTLNHFAKDVGLPLDLEAAVGVIAGGHSVAVDVGEVNGRYFVNNSSIGIYAALVSEREVRQRDGRRKWIAAGLAAAQVWSGYRRVRAAVRATDAGGGRVHRQVRTPFVFVGNNEYQLSGLDLGGRRSLSCATLQICMAPGMTRSGVAGMVTAAVLGRIHTIAEFESFHAIECTLDTGRPRMQVSLDGEVFVMDSPLTYRIRPAALRVIVPAESAAVRVIVPEESNAAVAPPSDGS